MGVFRMDVPQINGKANVLDLGVWPGIDGFSYRLLGDHMGLGLEVTVDGRQNHFGVPRASARRTNRRKSNPIMVGPLTCPELATLPGSESYLYITHFSYVSGFDFAILQNGEVQIGTIQTVKNCLMVFLQKIPGDPEQHKIATIITPGSALGTEVVIVSNSVLHGFRYVFFMELKANKVPIYDSLKSSSINQVKTGGEFIQRADSVQLDNFF